MRKFLLVAALLIGTSAVSFAQDGRSMEIQLGRSKTIDRARISIRFAAVVEDSRCPMNARCIWAGNARVRLTVSRGRSSRTVVLNSNKGEQSVETFGYKIEFADLQPQKGAPRPMRRRPQTVTINVDRVGP